MILPSSFSISKQSPGTLNSVPDFYREALLFFSFPNILAYINGKIQRVVLFQEWPNVAVCLNKNLSLSTCFILRQTFLQGNPQQIEV